MANPPSPSADRARECKHQQLEDLNQSSEPEAIRQDRRCLACGQTFMVTKAGMVRLSKPIVSNRRVEAVRATLEWEARRHDTWAKDSDPDQAVIYTQIAAALREAATWAPPEQHQAEDTARLNWLEAVEAEVLPHPSLAPHVETRYRVSVPGALASELRATLRDAIDAVRRTVGDPA